ncbi:outer membrane protein assembly factor BamD [Denitromonas iodatirespirans]|uniref:Outer membrane protein assembly factor BamD n=1 Tax=Denitromonas iodatirespirans TaxID=2795389 RepID=A0A944DIR8_DENI1|nr:outer membrane protein assembly factor BamD [Denitromonas iodatirespirans]MBT0963648.1 outer membrane protein assembly factor BamD [Denitromonas iodatirespirans]
MAKITLRSLAVIGALLLAGCSATPDEYDETAGWNAQRLYSEAKESMSDGGYERAIQMFEKLEARYPYGRYAQQAQLEVAYAYYKSNETASALAACDRFIKLHPNHPNVDYAYYLKGLVNFNEDLGLLGSLANQDLSERDPRASQEAFDTFRELVQRFPDSRYADDSRQRMQYLVNALGQYEVHVARYYFKRGAYLASANRAQTALTSYPQTPATEEALYLLTQAYDKLGMTQLRDDAARVLNQNFPNSIYLSGGPQSDKPWWQLW